MRIPYYDMMCQVSHEWTNGQITSLDDGILPVFLKPCPQFSLGWVAHEGTSIEEVHPVVLNLFPPCPKFRLGWVAQPFPKLSI